MNLKKNIKLIASHITAFILGRKIFYRFSLFLFLLAKRGLGVFTFPEEQMLKPLARNLGERPIVFDVGANKGQFAHLFAALNPLAKIYSFEPNPLSYEKLCQHQLPQQTTFNYGLGAEQKTLTLYDVRGDEGSAIASVHAGVFDTIWQEHAQSSGVIVHTIELRTLKTVIDTLDVKIIDLLKIDTEGHELFVLQGAGQELLNSGRIQRILFEFNKMNVVSRVFMKDFHALLSPSYRLYRLLGDGTGIEMSEYQPIIHELFDMQQWLAVHRSLTESY